MKARKLELKTVTMTDEVYDHSTKSYKTLEQGVFSYREIVKQILLTPGAPNESVGADDVIRSVQIYGALREALNKAQDFILLDKEDYDYLVTRLNRFRWAVAHPVNAEFIQYIRSLPEIEVEEKPKAPASA